MNIASLDLSATPIAYEGRSSMETTHNGYYSASSTTKYSPNPSGTSESHYLSHASAPSHDPQEMGQADLSDEYPQSIPTVAPIGFDEAVLRHLCDVDCGLPLLLERMKQSSASCRETANFFRKRAAIEEEYAKANIKLARSSLDNYRESDGRAGTFVTSYAALLRTHELLGDNHLRLSTQLQETADQLLELSKETDRSRKNGKEVGSRLDKVLNEAENNMDKSRQRYESAAEELERCLLLKAGESPRHDPSLIHRPTDSQGQSYNPSGSGISSSTSSIGTGSGLGGGPNSKRTFGKAMSKLKNSSKGFGNSVGGFSNKPEEELRSKVAHTSESYRREVSACQGARREHWVVGMPRVLRALKEGVDEADLGTQYHMSRYANVFENTLVSDGVTISPPSTTGSVGGVEEGPGLKMIVEAIDNREDFKDFMQNYSVAWLQSPQAIARGPAKRGEGMLNEDGYVAVQSPKLESPRMSTSSSFSTSLNYNSQPYQQTSQYFPPQPSISPNSASLSLPVASTSKAVFGVDLAAQVARDDVDVPLIVEKCAAAVEEHGLDITGIYRLSGTTSRVQRLKGKLDQDADLVDLNAEEHLTDINDISSVLKLFFRELPIPLMTYDGYSGFLAAARIENDRLRHIRLHERVNDLPDANYATLKFLMGHLYKVQLQHNVNSMTASNLAIVFGPTLFRAPPGQEASALQDMQWQCKAIETILTHYEAIFVSSEEDQQ